MTAKCTLHWLHIVKKKGRRIVLQSPLLLGGGDWDAQRTVWPERGLAFAVHSHCKMRPSEGPNVTSKNWIKIYPKLIMNQFEFVSDSLVPTEWIFY